MIKTSKGVVVTDRRTIYVTMDPSIDTEKSNLAEYKKNYDSAALVFKEGEDSTEFIIRPCSQTEYRKSFLTVLGEGDASDYMDIEVGCSLLKFGLVGAKNLHVIGDTFSWPKGCPKSELDRIPAFCQLELAQAIILYSASTQTDELTNEKK